MNTRVLGLVAIALALLLLGSQVGGSHGQGVQQQGNTNPVVPAQQASSFDSASRQRAASLGDGEYGRTGENRTQTFTVELTAGQAVVGQSYGFQGADTGCQVWLIAGPFAGSIRVTDGEYFVFDEGQLSSPQKDALLTEAARKQASQGYGCTARNQRVTRLGD